MSKNMTEATIGAIYASALQNAPKWGKTAAAS